MHLKGSIMDEVKAMLAAMQLFAMVAKEVDADKSKVGPMLRTMNELTAEWFIANLHSDLMEWDAMWSEVAGCYHSLWQATPEMSKHVRDIVMSMLK